MSEPLARLYDLAVRTLDEHERRANALRGRLGPVLAAAALGASLLSGPLVGGERPATVIGTLVLAVAVGGLVVTVFAAFRLVAERRRPADRLDPRRLAAEFRSEGLLDDDNAFYSTMIGRIADLARRGDQAIDRLSRAFTAMLWGILVMLCGLALAALVG